MTGTLQVVVPSPGHMHRMLHFLYWLLSIELPVTDAICVLLL